MRVLLLFGHKSDCEYIDLSCVAQKARDQYALDDSGD